MLKLGLGTQRALVLVRSEDILQRRLVETVYLWRAPAMSAPLLSASGYERRGYAC